MIKAIVTDIEGTTSSLSFVKDVLFPYARDHLPAFIRSQEKRIANILNDVRTFEKNPALTTEDIIEILIRWIDEDLKATPLKALQGMIWDAGYKAGDFEGHIYEDAALALKRWHQAGLKLYVYSSGSIPAQKLLFSHTPQGDLTPLFSGYFDTTTGPKLEAGSYAKIIDFIGLKANEILFLSDNPDEIAAAQQSGMQIMLIDRDKMIAQGTFPVAQSFDTIIIKEKAA